MNEIIGYLSAALIGVSLGLIGGGGSILTVPVMVYLFHIPPLTAISYSLFVVGSTSFVGAYTNFRRSLVHIPTALYFGAASVVTVYIIRRFVVPAVPENLGTVGGITIKFSVLTMVLFAVLMLFSAFTMIRQQVPRQFNPKSRAALLLYGFGIGLLTGFLGAGGGFLLIPALVLILGLDMKIAVGTSLFIIAINSCIGFLGDAGHYSIDWLFLAIVTAIAIAGIFIGGWLTRYFNGVQLKKSFGWFVLLMAIYILLREIVLH
ncbi:MAG: sulfite exporter TauE/SafE family protein [Bacteroidota bacterium]|nr:sulfite exporter TauE/SafE family protein [Bacteroidota bacterium]